MTIDELIRDHLPTARPSGNGIFTVHCPAHDDQTPSLSIGQADHGGVMVHCHTGCTPEAIVDALGLTMGDLFTDDESFPSTNGTPAPTNAVAPIAGEAVERLVAAMTDQAIGYLEKERAIKDSVVYAYKLGLEGDGHQRRVTIPIADSDGQWVNIRRWLPPASRNEDQAKILSWASGYGTTRLYPIQQLQHDALILCEGEMDALALISHDIQAITTTGGANTFNAALAASFKGKTVAILMDHDDEGRKGAVRREELLTEAGAKVSTIYWPTDRADKWDVTDEIVERGVHAVLGKAWEVLTAPAASPLKRLSDVVPEEIEWLWYPRIPYGHITMLEGDPGEGKSFLTQALATATTLGHGLPTLLERETLPPGNALFFSAEDHLPSIVQPRLSAMGADLDRVFFWDDLLQLDDEGLTVIRSTAIETAARLIIIDPIVAYLPSDLDMHKANEVRGVLKKLAVIAEELHLAIVLVRHLSKGSASKALYRGQGSIDFTAASRSALMAGHDPDDPDAHALAQVKTNLGPTADPVGYSIENGVFRWLDATTVTVGQMLKSEGTGTAKDEARTFLKELLRMGPMSATEVKSEGEGAGISAITLRRAQESLKIKPYKDNFKGGWMWALP